MQFNACQFNQAQFNCIGALLILGSDAGTLSDALSSLTATLSKIDIGGGADLSTLYADLLRADAGLGQEAWSIEATILRSDVGEGTDLGELAAILDGLDFGGGIEAVVYRAFAQSDSGLGADAIPYRLLDFPVDIGTAQEASALSALLTRLETATGLELTPVLSATLVHQDAGQGEDWTGFRLFILSEASSGAVDASSLSAAVFSLDEGSGAEATVWRALETNQEATAADGAIYRLLGQADSGLGTEALYLVATLSCLEQAIGIDTGALEAYLVKLDVGAGTEASAITAALADTDSGLGTDAIQWIRLYRLGADLGSAIDAVVWRTIAANQVGGGIESAEGGSLYDIFDLALSQDRHLYLFVRSPGSPWGWKIYRVDPADTTKVLQPPSASTGERYAPAKKKLAAPGVTKG